MRIPLSTLEERWAAAGFVRIHRSTLVSLPHVKEVRMEHGRCSVVLDDAELQVSRRHTRELRDRLLARPCASAVSPGRPAGPSTEPTHRPVTRRGSRVTSTRRDAPTRRDLRPLTRDIDEQSKLGEVYMAGLMSAQLRLALRVLAFGAVGLGGLPLLFLLVPATRTMDVGRIPLPWLVLAVVVYPVASSWRATTCAQSERIEAEFSARCVADAATSR